MCMTSYRIIFTFSLISEQFMKHRITIFKCSYWCQKSTRKSYKHQISPFSTILNLCFAIGALKSGHFYSTKLKKWVSQRKSSYHHKYCMLIILFITAWFTTWQRKNYYSDTAAVVATPLPAIAAASNQCLLCLSIFKQQSNHPQYHSAWTPYIYPSRQELGIGSTQDLVNSDGSSDRARCRALKMHLRCSSWLLHGRQHRAADPWPCHTLPLAAHLITVQRDARDVSTNSLERRQQEITAAMYLLIKTKYELCLFSFCFVLHQTVLVCLQSKKREVQVQSVYVFYEKR